MPLNHATESESSWLNTDRLNPLSKYCRSNPLVFSLIPLGQGLCGSAKYTLTPVRAESFTRLSKCCKQFCAQFTPRHGIKGHVDGFVAETHQEIVGGHTWQ